MSTTTTDDTADELTDLPSIDEIEAERVERDINKSTLSYCVGYESPTSYGNCVRQGYMADEKRKDAQKVFAFYDQYHIVPTREEIQSSILIDGELYQ